MKHLKSVLLTLTLFTLALSLPGCQKKNDNAMFDANFYTTATSSGPLFLYIDGACKGRLPVFTTRPDCASLNTDGQKPLSLRLKAGEYQLAGKDAANRVISTSTMTIGRERMETCGNLGGLELHSEGGCLTVNVFP